MNNLDRTYTNTNGFEKSYRQVQPISQSLAEISTDSSVFTGLVPDSLKEILRGQELVPVTSFHSEEGENRIRIVIVDKNTSELAQLSSEGQGRRLDIINQDNLGAGEFVVCDIIEFDDDPHIWVVNGNGLRISDSLSSLKDSSATDESSEKTETESEQPDNPEVDVKIGLLERIAKQAKDAGKIGVIFSFDRHELHRDELIDRAKPNWKLLEEIDDPQRFQDLLEEKFGIGEDIVLITQTAK